MQSNAMHRKRSSKYKKGSNPNNLHRCLCATMDGVLRGCFRSRAYIDDAAAVADAPRRFANP